MNGTMEQAIEAMKKLSPKTRAKIMEQAAALRRGADLDAVLGEVVEIVRAMTTADREVVRKVDGAKLDGGKKVNAGDGELR